MRLLTMGVVLALAACATLPRSHEMSVDALFHEYAGNVPGASVLVLKDGRAVLRKSYGLANLEQNLRSTAQTNYRLASITKQFTAAAIMLLAESGRISYDDPIRPFLTTLPPWADKVTIRHLLTHTSGLLDYEDLIPEGTTNQLLDRDVLRLLGRQDRTYFEPGTAYRYSNTGYAFLALIVEAASGKSFAAFLRDEIFLPLGMSATVAFENGISDVERRAYGYSFREGKWVRTDQSLTSAVLGDGGIYSSAEDLSQWDEAIARGELLGTATWDLAFTAHTPTDKDGVHYGFGWRIGEYRGRRTLSHTGETRGFRNALVRFPEERLTVIVLTNRNEAAPIQLALQIADLFLSRSS